MIQIHNNQLLIINQLSMGNKFTKEQIQSFMEKYSWKLWLLAIIPAFIIYPKPFLFLFRPFIKRIRRFYQRTRPELTKIIFTTNKNLGTRQLIRSNVCKVPISNVFIINLYRQQFEEKFSGAKYVIDRSNEKNKSMISEQEQELNQIAHRKKNAQQNELISQLWAQNTVHEIRILNLEAKYLSNHNIAILVKGKSQILRKIQAKLFKLRFSDYYKIPQFQDHQQLHILEKNQKVQSYEHTTKKIEIN